MKVAQIGVAHPYRGGIAHYTTSLHRTLLERGHDSFIVSFSRLYPACLFPGSTQFDQSRQAFGVASQRLLDSLNPASWRAAARVIVAQNPEVGLFQYWHPFFAPMYATIVPRLQAARIPVIFICHNVAPHESSVFTSLLRNYAFSRVERFLVHSERDRLSIERCRSQARVLRVRHPVYLLFEQPGLTREAARRNLALPQEGKVILFFGHIRPYKGLETLLRSLPDVLNHQDVRLVIAGEFYESVRRYSRLIRRLGLQSRITIHNQYIPNERVPDYFKAANVLIAPYRHGTQSGAVATAYCFDLPVIATSVGGIPEVVKAGETGYLVPPESPTALARAITDYFQSDREPGFRANIRDFKKQLSWDSIVNAIEVLKA